MSFDYLISQNRIILILN